MRVPVWSYPVEGFYFFFRHGVRLWPHVVRFVVEVIAAAVGILFVLFYSTFLSQRQFVDSFLPDWLGFPAAIALIILETAAAVVLLFRFRLEIAQHNLFITTLAISNVRVEPVTPDEREWLQERLIPQLVGVPTQAPMKKISKKKNNQKYLGSVLTEGKHPIMRYILTLPLNFIPVVGSVLFCWLNSFPTAVGLHEHYYVELKGLTPEEFSAVVHAKKPQYQHFGFTASAFSLVPGFDVILILTNAVGAALWAADMEKTRGSIKSKWGLEKYDKGGRSYGTFRASSSGESSHC
ncbi:hypothetical protein R1sor_013195 [Riccia sorocarpa]|uniref:Uncharacterized protein n=1 Tax=Riccia sorocarpa TaxID=122646 RepID=A0ABD3H7P8_9MARC